MFSITGNTLTDILAILASFILIALLYFKWSFSYWSRRGIPAPTATIPFGNVTNFILRKQTIGEGLRTVYNDMRRQGFKFCGFYFFTNPTLMILDPELVKSILTKDFSYFTDHVIYVNEKNDPLSGHLVGLKGVKWRKLRAKLTPTFTSGKMKMMFHTLVSCSDELVGVLDGMVERGEAMDVKEVIGRFTTDVIGTCAFGIECNTLKNSDSEFRRQLSKNFEGGVGKMLRELVAVTFPAVMDLFKIPVTDPEVTKFFMNVVKETVKYREENNVVRKDFMHLLIQLKNNVKILDEESAGLLNNVADESELRGEEEEEEGLTIEEIAAQAFVFFLGGFETSSTTLTFCFYELVSNPEIQKNLREEILSILEKHEGKISYNAIMEMTYMDKCINETLRKYPPLPVLSRVCTRTYKLPNSNLTINKGTQIFIPIYAIQSDPEHYPEPEKFDPGRFRPENKVKRHPYTWLPFGEGPRACIGFRFGLMQTKVALAVLLKNYKFSLNSRTKEPLVMNQKSFILSPNGGVWLNVDKIVM